MKVYFDTRYRGYYSVWIVLEKWRPWFAWFNRRFAVGRRRLEVGILDRRFANTILWRLRK